MRKVRRILGIILCMALLCGSFSKLSYTYAAEPGIVVEVYDIAPYRSEKRTEEYYTYPARKGYVFAGWYENENCETPIDASKTTGNAYARFVDEKVLSVKGQLTAGVDVDSTKTNLRMVTTVDSQKYRNVGFQIRIGDKKSRRVTNTIYTSLKGYVDKDEIVYKPTEFSPVSTFFAAHKITDIPNSAFLTGIDITPMWTTLDGTTVTGVSKSFTINSALGAETITLENTNDRNHVYYTVEKPVKAGQTVQFDMNVTAGQRVEVNILGDGSWNKEYFSKEYAASAYEKITVTAGIPEDIENFIIYVKFKDAMLDFSENTVTISNIRIVGSMFADLIGTAGNSRVVHAFDIEIKRGQILNFDLDVEPAQAVSVWVYGDKKYFEKAYNPWPGKTTIQTEIPEDESQVRIIVQFNDSELDYSQNVVHISDVKVLDDWSVMSQNTTGNEVMAHTFDISLTGGQNVTFDLDITAGQNVEVLVKGDDTEDITLYQQMYEAWSGIQKISVPITKELKNFDVWVKYAEANTSLFDTVVTISNVTVSGGTTVSYGEVWSAPSTVKIRQDKTNTNRATKELVYEAVRNEYESKQLIITASKEISHFELFAQDLKNSENTLKAENVEIYVQKYVTLKEEDYYGSSRVPDALIPMEAADGYGENAIAAGENGALWITVYIPENIAAGTYTGEFKLVMYGSDGEVTIDIPVSVKVYNYTLTDDTTAKTLFSWRYDRVAAGELDGSIEMMTDYYEFFRDYRISLQSLPLETLSGDEYAAMVQKYYDEITSYTILSEIGDISSGIIYNWTKAKEQILAIAAASTSEKNLFDKAIFYFIDEPDLNQESYRTAVLRKIADLNSMLQQCVDEINADTSGAYSDFKKIADWQDSILNIPNVIPVTCYEWLLKQEKTWQWSSLSFVYSMPEEQKAFWEKINCICPYYAAFNQSNAERLVELCEEYQVELWWYGCVLPTASAPTYHIGDDNLLSSRTVSWMQKKYNISGNLYWDAAAYTSIKQGEYDNRYINLYESPYRVDTMAGDGFLTYPGEAYGVDGALPSLRLMSIRDGMEEYEILKDVEKNHASLDMDSTFYSKLAGAGVTNMYADGANGLDFNALRSTLLGYADGIAMTGVATGNDGQRYDIQINEDHDLLTQVEKRLKTELLFSFESYKDITGTHIRVGNQLGETEINKRQDMITEGKGSWCVRPQGNYGKEDGYPYFRMQCTDSTFTTSNFNAFDKLLMDIYNASAEEVIIKWSFEVLNASAERVETEEIYCKLAPNAWTTCEYDLSDEAYSQYFYLDSVKYMTITFMSKKESKTDSVPELYLDNLRGCYSDVERAKSDFTYSFEEGVTFDNAAERYVAFKGGTTHNKLELSRVSYADIGIEPAKTTFGTYALKGNATGAVWPMLTANLEKSYSKGSVLSFWMYIVVDEAAVEEKSYYMESSGNTFTHTNYKFNAWTRVNIVLGNDSERVSMFVNFDDNNSGKSILGNTPVQIYMDHFKIYANKEAMLASATTVSEDGSVLLENDFRNEYVQYDIPTVPSGSKVSFDVDFNSSEQVTIWVMVNGNWDVWTDGTVSDKNEYYAKIYSSWTGKQTITTTIGKDADFLRILVRYGGSGNNWATRTCTISNIQVTAP